MSTNLENIVDISITKGTTAITTAEFNIPLVLSLTSADGKGTSTKTAIDVQEVTSTSALATVIGTGYESNNLYKIVRDIFFQNPRVSKVVVGTIAGSSFATELAAVMNANSKWYGLIPTSGLWSASNAAEAIKTFVTENTRILAVQSTTAPATTSTAYTNPVGSYSRGFGVYHDNTGEKAGENLQGAWLGSIFTFEPGSANWNYKTLEEIKPDVLTPQQAANLEAANVGYYVTVAGVNVTQGGKMGDGEWPDIVVGTDWIVARIREEIFRALVNNPKLPTSDAGILSVQSIVTSVLSKAADMGILQKDGIEVTVPKYADLSQDDKTNRRVSGIKFRALYEGAINTVALVGELSY